MARRTAQKVQAEKAQAQSHRERGRRPSGTSAEAKLAKWGHCTGQTSIFDEPKDS